MKCIRQSSKGFTLMEIMIVVMIIGVLLALLIPSINHGGVKASEVYCRNNLIRISTAMVTYANMHGGFLPQNREWTDGSWYPKVLAPDAVYYGTPKGYSWQHLLDKLLDAENNEGLLYATVPDYTIDGILVNLRGSASVFKDATHGYGGGIYIGTTQLFTSRVLPTGGTSTGSISRDEIVMRKGKLDLIPAIACGSRANAVQLWGRRYRNRLKLTGTAIEKPHVEVTGNFVYRPTTGVDAGKDFLNIDFRHNYRAMVLYLDWHQEDWKIDDGVLGSGWKGPSLTTSGTTQISTPGSELNQMKAVWDTMFYGVSP